MSLTCTLKDNHNNRFYTSAQRYDFQTYEKLAFMHKILNKNIFHFWGAFYKFYYINQSCKSFQSHKMNIGVKLIH